LKAEVSSLDIRGLEIVLNASQVQPGCVHQVRADRDIQQPLAQWAHSIVRRDRVYRGCRHIVQPESERIVITEIGAIANIENAAIKNPIPTTDDQFG
jgi:hypothetical protein